MDTDLIVSCARPGQDHRVRLHKRKVEPGEVMVASKWGYTYTAGWSTAAPSG